MNNRFDELVSTVTDEATNDEPAQQGNVVAMKKAAGGPSRPKKKERAEESAVGLASTSLTRPVVPMTVRFRPHVAEKLKRRVFENRLAGTNPQTIQDAVNDAVSAWLGPA